MADPISPWDEQIATLLLLLDDKERLRRSILLALQSAYSKGWTKGRLSGYNEAELRLTPTRHDMGS